MLLLFGPPGSGKTHVVLGQLRSALRLENAGLRFIVPSEDVAANLRIRLAREGLVFRPSMVTTLDRFVSEWAVDAPLPPFHLDLVIRRVLDGETSGPFDGMARLPGFRSLIARLVNEFSAAGFDAKLLATAGSAAIPGASVPAAFVRIYEAVEREILATGAVLRPVRTERAAAAIRGKGHGALLRVFMDGFSSFDNAELSLIQALASVAELTVTLPAWPGAAPARAAIHSMGAREIELSESRHRFPVRRVVRAPGIAAEAAEVARRIREHVSAGRRFGEIAVVLRDGNPYVPALEAAFDRYAIPARFRFSQPLASQAAVRYLCGIVNAMLGGWEHEELLTLLTMPISGFGGSAACDRFDFAVRERLPGAGLESLRGISDAPRICALLDRLEGLESWRGVRAMSADWAFRVRSLRCLTQAPQVADGAPYTTSARWQAAAQSLDAFSAAADEAASVMSSARPVPFTAFWEVFVAVLEHTDFELPDRRVNVVDVVTADDARHREWPVVFVCGLAEGQFPRPARPDPIFADTARCRLRLTGIPVGTAASDRAREEFLFEVAATRATSEAVFTYPERDHRGFPATPSVFLSRLDVEAEHVRVCRVGPVEPERRRPAYLLESANLDAVAAAHTAVTPAAIEIFLECPFRFFLLSTLELEGAPAPAGERLNPALRLEIVRESLAVHADAEPLEQAFERAFYRVCARERVPAGPRTELVRANLLRTVRRLAAAGLQPEHEAGWEVRTNEEIECDLAEDVRIQGQIDRYDLKPDGRVRLFGYRQAHSRGTIEGVDGTEEALYLAALRENYGYTPVSLIGIAFDPAGGRWLTRLDSQSALAAHLECVCRAAIGAVREIRRGCVEPRLGASQRCAGCEVPEICRLTPQTALGGRSAL